MNFRPALEVRNMNLEQDFTFKREANNLPIKKSRLELAQKLEAEQVDV
jgi:hypothetical protein